MGDSKNRKMSQKQKSSNNPKRRSPSDQKENAPNREKTKPIKPDPDDCIAMSKQLLLKKSNARTQKRTSSRPQRVCPNGKPIPSLSELEKMYKDSDDDNDLTSKTPIQKQKRIPSAPEERTPTSFDNDLISPTTIHKIAERLLGSINNQNLPSPDDLLEAAALLRDKSPPRSLLILPPKKRKVPEVPYIVGCKDRPQVMYKPSTNFCKGGDDYGVEASDQNPDDDTPAKRAKKSEIPNYTKSIFNAQSGEIAERLTKEDAGSLSDTSSDSNKTIEYDPTPIQNPRPLSFSPLPSTSTDKETFRKNDELFNESLKDFNISKDSTAKNVDDDNNDKLIAETMEDDITLAKQSTPMKKDDALIKQESTPITKDEELIQEKSTPNTNEDDLQIIEIPYDTIEIDDICDRTVETQSSKARDTNIIEIIEPAGLEVVKPKENNNIVDKIHDDDCVIITSSGTNNDRNNVKNPSETTIVIDDEYSTINMEFDTFNDEPIEIIDVDNIIAENNTIIHKWKKKQYKEFNNINTVVDVPNTYTNVSIPQTTITPSTTVQATSPLTTVSTTLQAGVTTSTTLLTPSTSTPNNNLDLTNRNSATHTHHSHRHPPLIDPQRCARFKRVLDDFCKSLQERPRHVRSIIESENRITALLTKMINRLESQSGTRRSTSNQTQRSTSHQPLRPASNQTPSSTSNQILRPTSNQALRSTSNTNETSSHPVNTAMPDTTSVIQSSIITLQNADSSQRDPQALSNPSHNFETQPTSMSPSPIPTRNIGDCPICLDPLNTSNGIASTICGHVFCLGCIQASILTNGKRCPTCRKVLKGAGGGFHLLYL